jgi:polar amino acid transport system substrate-binding protein
VIKRRIELFSWFFIGLLCWAASGALMAKSDTDSSSSAKVVLQLKWLHQFQFAGYYAALEKGFFAEEGLDVELRERDPHKNNILQVLSGEAHYGVADAALLLYQTHQMGVQIVAPIFQYSPNVVITLKSSDIVSPRDLIGKRVRLYDNESEGFPIMAMLAEHGVLEQGVIRQPFSTDHSSLLTGETDAIYGYSSNEPFWFREQGVEVNIINPVDFGVNMYGDMLFTSTHEAEFFPERVEAMRRAVIRGWEYALDNKEEIAQLILDKYSQRKSFAALMFEAQGIEQVMQRFVVPIGTLNPGRLEYMVSLYARYGLLDRDLSVETYIFDRPREGRLGLTEDERLFLNQYRTLRVGVDRYWAPFDFINEHERHAGIAADYLDLLSKRLGVAFAIEAGDSWPDVLNMLRARDLDMLVMAANTPERSSYAHFTRPYIRSPMVMVTDNTQDFLGDVSVLKGKKVLVVEGYASHEWLKIHRPDIELLTVSSTLEGLKKISNGEAFAFVDNLASVGYLIKKEGLSNLKISGQLPTSFDLGVGVRSDWPLMRSIMQKALDSISPQEHAAIYDKWVSIDFETKVDYSRVAPVIIGLLIVVLLIGLYSWRLRFLHRQLKHFNSELNQAREQLLQQNKMLERLSITDKLTGVYNRHKLDSVLKEQISIAQRYKRPLSVVLFDLDHFKQVNDTYGHLVGDVVLQTFAKSVLDTVRRSDVFGRWGGEEFMLICPETTLQQAVDLANKIRLMLSAQRFEQGFVQTMSAGVAEVKEDLNPDPLITLCDNLLYQAKSQGRNRVVAEQSMIRESAEAMG